MLVIDDKFNIKLEYSTYVALGSFDGLHRGHLSLISKSIELSKDNNAKSMVFTFKNHPLTIINKEAAPKLLMDNETKVRILEESGVDLLNMVKFDKELMEISPEEFIQKIVYMYNAKGLIVGFNHRFGYKNLGDVELLQKLSKIYNFELFIVEPVKLNNEIISSSVIRNIICEDGDMVKANDMLSRPFMIQGSVICGRKIGRTMGFPTINLNYNKDFILPRGGVYYTNVEYLGSIYRGITNIGYNPTVENSKLSVETHILDFNKDIYGENVKIYFIHKIRDEKKFYSLKELSSQLSKDKDSVRMQNLEINIKNSFTNNI